MGQKKLSELSLYILQMGQKKLSQLYVHCMYIVSLYIFLWDINGAEEIVSPANVCHICTRNLNIISTIYMYIVHAFIPVYTCIPYIGKFTRC